MHITITQQIIPPAQTKKQLKQACEVVSTVHLLINSSYFQWQGFIPKHFSRLTLSADVI